MMVAGTEHAVTLVCSLIISCLPCPFASPGKVTLEVSCLAVSAGSQGSFLPVTYLVMLFSA